MSESLVSKLLTVQKELKAPKGQYNSFGKYSYRSAEDILEAAKPLNVANGLLLTLIDEPVLIGDWHYIKATASITDGENTHVVTAYAREEENKKGMDAMQVTGTASSYARKYALNGLYLIDDTKDADTDEHRNQTTQKPQQKQQSKSQQQSKPQGQQQSRKDMKEEQSSDAPKATAQQKNKLRADAKKLAEARNTQVAMVFQHLKIGDLEAITQAQATEALGTLEKWNEQASNSKEKQEA